MKKRPLCFVCVILGVVIIVLVCSGGRKAVFWDRSSCALEIFHEKEKVEVQGQVYQMIENETNCQLFLKNCFVRKRSENSSKTIQNYLNEKYILVKCKTIPDVDVGKVCRVTGKVSFFENARNPGNFDTKKYYEIQKIYVCIWEDSIREIKQENYDLAGMITGKLYEFRCQWRKHLVEKLGETDGGIAAAVILGEKQMMDEDVKELFQKNGIGHILAISGLHLSFLGVGIYEFFRRVTGSFAAGGVLGSIVLVLYVSMVGITISIVRAGIMFLFRVGADICGRHYDNITALGVAFLCVLIYRPMAFYDGGFWLSFGAILAIIVMAPFYSSAFLQGVVISLCIQVLLFPITLYFFFEIPVYSILLNLVIIPLMSIMILCVIIGSTLLSYFTYFCDISFWIVKKILFLYKGLCMFCVGLPGNRMVLGKPEIWEIFVFYVLLAVILWRLWAEQKNQKIKKALPFLLVLVWTFCIRVPHLYVPFVTMIDVGQGDGIFVRGEGGVNILVDGGSSDVKNVGKYRIEPFLKSQGVEKIDYIFVTHGDSDHMNGIEELLERMRSGVGVKVSSVVFPQKSVWDEKLYHLAQLAKNTGASVQVIKEGELLKYGDDFWISCLAPARGEREKTGNESSLVLEIQYKHFSMLLMGDLENGGEKEMLDRMRKKTNRKRVDVLKVAHHGSNQATTDAFLEYINPKVALISAGKNNRYGHPGKEMIKRIKNKKIPYFCTKDCGAITVELKGKIQYTLKYEND